MNNIFISFFRWLKQVSKQIVSVFTSKERIIISALSIIALVSGGILIYQNYLKNTNVVAAYGGVYTEGVIIQNKDELTDAVNRLTKIGLTRFDDAGNIVPDAAESWEISEDVKNYIFTIKPQFSRDDIIKILEKQKDKWPGIQISAEADNKIKFQFPDSYSPFLSSTTLPVLPYGPFTLKEDKDDNLTFVANDSYYLGRPYLDKIVLKIYPSYDDLVKAYKAKDIDGAYSVNNASDFAKTNVYSFKLPRYDMLFFNTERDIFKTKEAREKIINGEKLDNELKIILVALDTVKNRQYVDELANKWQAQNIKADVYYKDASEIINKIIPNRDYDVLVYGLNYGVDPDPYPFWHSTQSGSAGLNLANFSNIDADIALEEARKTIDEKTRQEKYQAFWTIFNNEKPAIVISQDEWQFAVSDEIQNVKTGYSIGPEDRFLKVKDWYLKTKREKK